jgi:hypothetical protein
MQDFAENVTCKEYKIFRIMEADYEMNIREINFASGWWIKLA